MLGYVLVLVGFVFFCNGMTVLGKTGGKEVGMLNGAVAVLILIASIYRCWIRTRRSPQVQRLFQYLLLFMS